MSDTPIGDQVEAEIGGLYPPAGTTSEAFDQMQADAAPAPPDGKNLDYTDALADVDDGDDDPDVDLDDDDGTDTEDGAP